MKHRILTFAAVALCFTACSNDDEISQNFLADTPININVSVDEPRTRAGYSNDVLPDGFKLTVNHSNSPVDKYNYVVYAQRVEKSWKTFKMDDDGSETTDEITMLWANNTDPVNIMAANDSWPKEDQSTDEKLKQSDKLYMPSTQVSPSKEGITVAFRHTMSKINLTIELGDVYEFTTEVDKKITNVKIDGSLLKAEFNTSDGKVSVPTGDPASITPLLTGTNPYKNEAGTITKASATYEAILLPQTLASNKFTVSFMVDGKTYAWTYDKELTLAPSTAYTLKLTAGNDKVQPASFSAAQWGAGNGDKGEKKETD